VIFPADVHAVLKRHTIGDGELVVLDPERSCGSYLVDAVTGKQYLDCATQFASMPIGWNHPKLIGEAHRMGVLALHKYANSDYYSVELARFVERFAEAAPDFKHFFFVEGGTLAVENALKAAFDWKAKKLGLTETADDLWVNQMDVIHLEQAFHGRSGYTLSLTNTVKNKTALFPKFNWTRILNPKIHFPMVVSEVAIDEELSLRQAEAALKSRLVAAIILETIQGEGGDNHFRPEYFHALRRLADKYEAMLILDEVQAGVGLTGRMWAYEHMGIVPDMIAFGKKTQVCGFASTARIDEVPDNVFTIPSRINSTWGGNIVDMIRCRLIMDIIKKDRLIDNAADVGGYFLARLHSVEGISNVRGRGLMLAFDLPTPEERNRVLGNMQKNMTALPCGERSIRLRPPLTFARIEADEAVGYIRRSLIP
jgi:L-lysine 6-transaminase